MTVITGLIAGGSILALLGVAMLGWCVWRALAIRRADDPSGQAAQMQTLVAVNMAAVGIASIGLACVIAGFILA